MTPEAQIVVVNAHPSLSLDQAQVTALVVHVLEAEQRTWTYLGVRLTTAEEVRVLNQTWRDADYDTDVLSFPLGEAGALDGDIVVSFDFARDHCEHYGASLAKEASRYVIHGLLHLMGYDDATEHGRQVMRQKEDAYLASAELPKAFHDAPDRA